MFFPISDTPNPPGRPYVTWLLMAANIAVYLLVTLPASFSRVDLNDPLLFDYLRTLGLQGRVTASDVYQHISVYDLIVFQFGFRPATFSPVALMSSLFLHGGFLHLAGNMLFLYIFGDNVEYRLGHWRYLLTYLGCGILATIFFALFASGSQVPLIGASGAIFGVLGCYFLWFPRNRVRCFLFLFPFLMTNIYLSARMVLGFYLVIDNILPFVLTSGAGSGIAHGAHIGGFLGGVAVAFAANNIFSPRDGANTAAEVSQSPRFSQTPAQDLGGKDAEIPGFDREQLLSAVKDRYQRPRVGSNELLALGNDFLEAGRSGDALTVFRRFIAERPNDPMIDQAYLGAGKAMLEKNPRYLTSAYHYFLTASELAKTEELALQAKKYLHLIEARK